MPPSFNEQDVSDKPTLVRQRPLLTGLYAGALAVGADYLAHAFFAVPLLPEQAGYVLLKLLPLSTFENLLNSGRYT